MRGITEKKKYQAPRVMARTGGEVGAALTPSSPKLGYQRNMGWGRGGRGGGAKTIKSTWGGNTAQTRRGGCPIKQGWEGWGGGRPAADLGELEVQESNKWCLVDAHGLTRTRRCIVLSQGCLARAWGGEEKGD